MAGISTESDPHPVVYELGISLLMFLSCASSPMAAPPHGRSGKGMNLRVPPALPVGSRLNEIAVYFFTSATGAVYPGEALNAFTSVPSASFHTRTSPLNAPAATRLPSGLTATA